MAYCAGDEWSEVLTDDDETDNGNGNDDFYNKKNKGAMGVSGNFERCSSVEKLLLFWLEATSSPVGQNFISLLLYIGCH